jgi:hypothetical protein
MLAMSPARRLISAGLPALGQHQIGVGGDAREALEHARHQCALERQVAARVDARGNLALHDHLAAAVTLRLEQHRVHVDARRGEAGARLQRLGAADLAAVGRDRGVGRHVLRLERPHAQPAARKGAAESGDEQRLADVGAGALQHDARGHLPPLPQGGGGRRKSLPAATTPAPVSRAAGRRWRW